ncbi:EamA family transporter [Candidatus Sulfidibacterium hydrothermale]|uniref:DMT family transporter n=1 Tax=Candidatus Sulfidibacterium hydrothermale TaxID=2875962 RepID=UPI001F0B6DE2|nr:EamA family transporter [Candidatus Sulfidibacterium hydrothermale]UBM62824.1 EamA family transporter [Candidatus Sulfidibacterium hydrothermale]
MNKQQQLLSYAILFGLMLTWGSSFILIKKSLLYFSGTEVGLLRVFITFLFLLPFALRELKNVHRNYFWLLFLSGIIGSVIPALLFAIAETRIESGLAGTLNSLTPLFTLLIGLSFFGFKTRFINVLGVFIGLTGAAGLMITASGGHLGGNFWYAFLVVIASLCYAINVNLVKKYFVGLNSMQITVMTFFYIGIPVLVYILLFTRIPEKLVTKPEAWTGMIYLGILSIVGTGLALIAFNKLIKLSSPVFASSVTYVIPIVAILWGFIDGEHFSTIYFFWMALILGGVYLVNATPTIKKPGVGDKYFTKNK